MSTLNLKVPRSVPESAPHWRRRLGPGTVALIFVWLTLVALPLVILAAIGDGDAGRQEPLRPVPYPLVYTPIL